MIKDKLKGYQMTESDIEQLKQRLNALEKAIDLAQNDFNEGNVKDLSAIHESVEAIFQQFTTAAKDNITELEPQLKSIIEKLNAFIQEYQSDTGQKDTLKQANKAYRDN